ncbi:type IV secretory system conjugative DNA transfer family protein [Desulforhopalus singaporensis]|uniref:AAA-like domain-containing protein n=1 Tax=Desulforhopalus singaporensis TaxID=91360 RepID=A0A1H0VQA2_9BACT|nr:type IV secretion system DNA-binding domain-containing protein [Desulforhopalus singaporensis]SDP80630.1 AAA-like domain-containing protein [Desulforhopalus singaporensis]
MKTKNEISFFAKTNHRNSNQPFGIKQTDRISHTYIIGKTGTGKTTLLETKITQDIQSGRGLALIDPHGDLVENIYQNIPESRRNDVVYINVPDSSNSWGYNPLKRVSIAKRPLVASGILEIFKKQFDSSSWGVRMEHILRNVLLTLLDQPRADFSCIPHILNDKAYRKEAIQCVTNISVKEFWTDEYEKYPVYLRANAIAPIQNKIGAFLANPTVKRILVQPKKEIHVRHIMDKKKILLLNLSKGIIGEDAAHLLGGLLLTSAGLAAFSRADTVEEDRIPFMMYVDEFQNFSTLSLINMLSELRKYKVGLILANQYLHQLEKDIREAVLGNVGTIISFRLGPHDARYMAQEFYPTFNQEDIVNLPNYMIYLKLMIDGMPSKPFSANSLRKEDLGTRANLF